MNVATFLADFLRPWNIQVMVTGFLGRENAGIFESQFSQKHIEDRFIRIQGRTRTSVKIVDEVNQQTTDINMPGLTPSAEAVDLIFLTLQNLAKECDWFVLTGSLPPGLPDDFYAKLTLMLHERGCQVILDTSGPALKKGLAAHPAIIKPNLFELGELTGRNLTDIPAITHASQDLLSSVTNMVVVSLGKQGAVFCTQGTTILAVPPEVIVKSTVGAGDAMVAGLLCGLIQKLDLAGCARLATAFSLALVTSSLHSLPENAKLQRTGCSGETGRDQNINGQQKRRTSQKKGEVRLFYFRIVHGGIAARRIPRTTLPI